MKKICTKNSGFSLVELALVMLIFSTILSIVLFSLKIYNLKQSRTHTLEALEDIRSANFIFLNQKKYYPCPARFDLPNTDLNYGVADCANALKATSFGRDANDDGTDDVILIGMVPFKTILDPLDGVKADMLTGSDTIDGWGNKISYAVSELQTDSNPANLPYKESYGAIDIVDEHGNTVLDDKATAHVALVSHGENGVGAFTQNGKVVQLCTLSVTVPTTPPGPPQPPAQNTVDPDERENCDHNDGRFLSGLRNENDNSYNDDLVKFQIIKTSSLWFYSGGIMNQNGTPGNPFDDFLIPQVSNTNIGFVGIGTETPTEKLHVAGDVQANEVRANKYCDENGQNCMSANSLAGDGINCQNNEAVIGIENDDVVCAAVFAPQNLTCGPGLFMVGISNKTGAICEALP